MDPALSRQEASSFRHLLQVYPIKKLTVLGRADSPRDRLPLRHLNQRAATGNHIGKPVAILIDGQVVVAPALRATIGGSAVVSGNFTKEQAERFANGIGMQ